MSIRTPLAFSGLLAAVLAGCAGDAPEPAPAAAPAAPVVAADTELAPPDLVAALGEPVTVLLAVPGGPPIPAVGDGTLVEPGRYAIMCFIPTGVDPEVYLAAAAATDEGPPQVDGGPPHFVQGDVCRTHRRVSSAGGVVPIGPKDA